MIKYSRESYYNHLKNRGCAWLEDQDGNQVICEDKTIDGKQYCQNHMNKAYIKKVEMTKNEEDYYADI